MIKPIVQNGHVALRTTATSINEAEFNSTELQSILSDMHESLATQNDGVALAAPQLGITKRIFVVAPFIFDEPEHEQLVYINPTITHQSKKTKWKHEGCLSCRWQVGDVERHLETTVTAFDTDGNMFTRTGDGLLAHIFQHETDHLDGILFVDKARDLRDMTAAEIAEVENK